MVGNPGSKTRGKIKPKKLNYREFLFFRLFPPLGAALMYLPTYQQLTEAEAAMRDPVKRAQLIAQLPTYLQPIFGSHETRFQAIGQDGTTELLTNYYAITNNKPDQAIPMPTIDRYIPKSSPAGDAVVDMQKRQQ
jgi:hypothetical protein